MNKLNDILESKEYQDWATRVKLHSLYDKHEFKSQNYILACDGCGLINSIERNFLIQEDKQKKLKGIIFSTIYKIITSNQVDSLLDDALTIMLESNVDFDLIVDIVDRVAFNHGGDNECLSHVPEKVLAEITKRNKLTSEIIKKGMSYPYMYAIWDNARDKFMLLKEPKGHKKYSMRNVYSIAAMIKGGALTIKKNKREGIFRPLPLLIKSKDDICSFFQSNSNFFGARLWLAWNFPKFYNNLASREDIFVQETSLLLWFYKYKKNYKELSDQLNLLPFDEEDLNTIANKDVPKMVKIIGNINKEILISILMDLPLDQFYEMSSSNSHDYLHYTVDEYNNLIKKDKVTFPEITPKMRKQLEG